MKNLLILLSFLSFSGLSYASNSAQMPIVSIETAVYPGVNYLMGFDLDRAGKRIGMFYQDPTRPAGQQLHFSFAALQAQPQVLTRQKGYDIVKLSYANGIVTILFQKDARKAYWSKKLLKVECDSSERNCVIRDLETGKTTTSLYVTSHTIFFGRIVVGVDAIESR